MWIWCGRVPEVCEQTRPWVVLRTDDWPMSAESARALAAALSRAADRAEAAAEFAAKAGTRHAWGEQA